MLVQEFLTVYIPQDESKFFFSRLQRLNVWSPEMRVLVKQPPHCSSRYQKRKSSSSFSASHHFVGGYVGGTSNFTETKLCGTHNHPQRSRCQCTSHPCFAPPIWRPMFYGYRNQFRFDLCALEVVTDETAATGRPIDICWHHHRAGVQRSLVFKSIWCTLALVLIWPVAVVIGFGLMVGQVCFCVSKMSCPSWHLVYNAEKEKDSRWLGYWSAG